MKTYKVKLTFSFPHSINLMPFWFGLIAGITAAFLTLLISNTTKWVSHFDAIEMLKPRLEEKKSNFRLKKSFNIIPQGQAASSYSRTSAYAVVDYDSGEVIVDKNISKKLPIASLTKIMTAIVALDIVSPDEYFYISKKAASAIPTKIGIVPGQKMKLEELLRAILITSANDAAEAIKEGIDGKYRKGVFTEAMNIKARTIGLKNSSFDNPQGFDSPKNYSTVEDLALLTHYALTNYPTIAEIVRKDYEFLPQDANHKQFDLYNWNGLLGVYPNTLGVKIGNTGQAGVTTTVVSEREGKKLIVIVLGAPGVLERDLWAADLLDAGFEQKFNLKPVIITAEDLKKKYSTWKYWN